MAEFDATGAAQTVRASNEDEMRALYERVFAGPIGQTVLLDIMVKAQIGNRRGPDLGLEARAFLDGRADLATQILEMVSVDPIGAALAVMTSDLKGNHDDRHEQREPEL